MLIAIIVLFAGIVGIGHAIGIYYEIKHDREGKERDAQEARKAATRKYYI